MLTDFATEEDLLFLLAESNRTERAHTELAHHAAREIGSLLDIVSGARSHLAEECLFGNTAAHHDGQASLEVLLGVSVLVVDRQLHGHAQRHSPRDDRDFVQRIRVLAHGGDERVTSLVISSDFLLMVGEQHGLPFRAHEDFIFGQFEVVHVDRLAVLAGGVQSGFVHHVGQIGAGESRRAAGEDREIDIVSDGNLAGVYTQNFFASANVRTRNYDAAVKTAGAKQRGVENVRTVGGGDQDHALVGFEAVHFNEQLIESLLALVVSSTQASAAVASDGINFVDEDDAGSVLLTLLEQIADAACSNADEHFDKVRSGNREKWHIGFAGYRAGEQGLAGSRRSDEQHAFRDSSAELLELLRLAQKLNNFFQLFFG